MAGALEPIDPGEVRVSDQEREQVAARLQQASADGRLNLEELDERLREVYAAKTNHDLARLTRDLPAVTDAPVGPTTGLTPTSSAAVAVLGGFSRKGAWVVPRRFWCLALLGGGQLDLRYARFTHGEVKIQICAIMGGVEVTVPPEAHVTVNGIGIMGGWDQPSDGASTPGGPRITITGLALMGGVSVARKRRDQDD